MSVVIAPAPRLARNISFTVAAILATAATTLSAQYGWAKGKRRHVCCVGSDRSRVRRHLHIVLASHHPSCGDAKLVWSDRRVARSPAVWSTKYYRRHRQRRGLPHQRRNVGRHHEADDRKKAQSAYDTAKAELDGLKPSRPVAELTPLLAAAKPVCRIVVTNGSRSTQCGKPPALEAELGR